MVFHLSCICPDFLWNNAENISLTMQIANGSGDFELLCLDSRSCETICGDSLSERVRMKYQEFAIVALVGSLGTGSFVIIIIINF